MTLDSCFPNGKLIGDFLISIAGANQANHINFARTQLIVGSMLGQLGRNIGRNSFVSGVDTPDRVQQFSVYVSLHYVPASTRFDGSQHLDITGIGRKNYDLCIGKFVPDPANCFRAVQIRHAKIHQSDVRAMPPKLFDGLLSVGGLGYKLHVLLTVY